MSSSSSSSIAKFSNVLGAVSERASEAPQSQDPTMLILKQLLSGMIPVSDLPELTKLSAAECLAAVEKLRARQQVEVVEVPDQSRKFIRLTKAGYAVFAA